MRLRHATSTAPLRGAGGEGMCATAIRHRIRPWRVHASKRFTPVKIAMVAAMGIATAAVAIPEDGKRGRGAPDATRGPMR